MKDKTAGREKRASTLEITIDGDGTVFIANAGTAEMKLVADICRRRPDRDGFYCG